MRIFGFHNMGKGVKGLVPAGSVLMVAAGAAVAGEPAAMVEDISAEREDLQLMDYLEEGRRIDLGPDETLVIGYLLSCIQETVTGGSVTVGSDESTVDGGSVERTYVDCDGGAVVLKDGQDQEAGAAAYREADSAGEPPKPDRVIYGLSPVVRFMDTPQAVRIVRLDAEEPAIDLPGDGTAVDAGEKGIRLARGGTYRFETDSRALIIKVSSLAEEARGPAISRLVPM